MFARIGRHLRLLRVQVSENLSLLMMLLCTGSLLFALPQVRNLWLPTEALVEKSFWVMLFGVVLFGLAALYLTTLIRFVFPQVDGPWLFLPAKCINGWLGHVTAKCVGTTSGPVVYAIPFIFAVAGFLGLRFVPIDFDAGYMQSGAAIRLLAFWSLLLAAWLVAGLWLGPQRMIQPALLTSRWQRREKFQNLTALDGYRAAWQAAGEVLSWLLVMGVICELSWITASLKLPGASFRLYSISTVFFVVVMWNALASLVDFVQKVTPLPARWIVVLIFVLTLAYGSFQQIEDPVPQVAAVPTASDEDPWLVRLRDRLDEIPEGPVVLVSASGGGSRAAMFTALVLQLLAEEPMTLPSARQTSDEAGEGPRTAPSTWGEHIAVMSGVSGGSLALGRFLTHGTPKSKTELQYSTESEIRAETARRIQCWINDKELNGDGGRDEKAQITRLNKLLNVLRPDPQIVEPMQDTGQSELSDADRVVDLAFSSTLADEMCMDFMAPILRGFLTPGASRGDGLLHFWNDRFEWRDRTQSGLFTNRPLTLLNTSDADAGRRVIVGFPPIPKSFLMGTPGNHRGEFRTTDRLSEYTPLSLQDFIDEAAFDLSLSRAVRVSSNFPFGFRISNFSDASKPQLIMSQQAPRLPGVKSRRALRLLDGGVVDNTGIDSLFAVFESLRQMAATAPLGLAAEVMETLRGRGVVIIEIDSGAKPTASEADTSALALASRPITALNNAIYTNALRTSDQQLADLKAILTDSADARLLQVIRDSPQQMMVDNRPVVVNSDQLRSGIAAILNPYQNDLQVTSVLTFRFTCNHVSRASSDVMTGFALGPRDKASVMGTFLSEALRWRETLPSATDEYGKDTGITGLGTPPSPSDLSTLAWRLLKRWRNENVELIELPPMTRSMSGSETADADADEVDVSSLLLLLGARALTDPDPNRVPDVSSGLQEIYAAVDSLIQDFSTIVQVAANTSAEDAGPSSDGPKPNTYSLAPDPPTKSRGEAIGDINTKFRQAIESLDQMSREVSPREQNLEYRQQESRAYEYRRLQQQEARNRFFETIGAPIRAEE